MLRFLPSLLLVTVAIPSCTRDNPEACTTADECATGQACDISNNVCVPALLTFLDAGFTSDGDGAWWTAAIEPVIRGTVDDPNAMGVQLYLEGEPIGEPAGIVEGVWSTSLPAGTLDGVRLITARIVGANAAVESAQWFGFDADAPAIEVAGAITDERGDQVAFASGEPVHTHAGGLVALDAGCPDVYVHGYLTSTERPAYGRETTDNPLGFTFTAVDLTELDRSSLAYRVSVDGIALTDWRAVTLGPVTDTSAEVAITLTSDGDDGVPWLRDGDGELHVELRASDLGGHEAIGRACVAYHALPAPLAFGDAVEATGTGTIDALVMDSGLLNLQRVLGLINGTSPSGPLPLARLPFSQQASEPVYLEVHVDDPALKFSREVADNYLVSNLRNIICHKVGGWNGAGSPAHNPAAYCTNVGAGAGAPTLAPADPPDPTVAGTVADPALTLALVELVGGVATELAGCTQPDGSLACDVPARVIGAPPRVFEVRAKLGAVPELSTTGVGTVAIQVPPAGSMYLGPTPGAAKTWCTSVENIAGTWFCAAQDMQLVHGLHQVGLSTSAPLQFMPALAVSAAALTVPPLGADLRLGASTSWLSGELDVPPND